MAWFKRDDASTAAAAAAASVATSAATASATEAPETAAPDALAVLTDCCRAHTRAVVACFDVGTIAPARFAGLTERDVLLEMTVPADDGDLPPLSLATVSFSHQRRVRVFLATIAGLAPGSPMTPAVLRLRLPGEIAGADPRQIYRVPIMREAALPAWVSTLDGRMLAVRAVNISVAGILVELPAGEELEIGDRLALRLVDPERRTHMEIEAIVRRRDGRKYGLFFPEVLKDGEIEPPAALRGLVSDLESEWLRRRVPDTEL